MLFSLIFELNNIPFLYKVIIFLTYTFAVIFALTIHEFAHAVTAYKLGDNTPKVTGRLTVNPMAHFDAVGLICFLILSFGWAKPVQINPYNFKNIKRDTFLVSIAGILTNLFIAFIFYPLSLLAINIIDTTIGYILYSLFSFIFEINLVFMVFNLLPIYPLDGFNALATQLKYTNPYVNFMLRYGTIVLLVLILIFSYTNLFSYLVYYVGYPITKFWNLLL